MFDMTTLSALGSSLSSATLLTKTILGMKVDQEVIAKVSALQSEIMTAQAAALSGLTERMALLEKVEELEKRLKDADDWAAEAKRYQLTTFPTGVQAYVLKNDATHGGPIHRICPNCFQQHKKAILQTTAKGNGGETVQCPMCKLDLKLANFEFHYASVPSTRTAW